MMARLPTTGIGRTLAIVLACVLWAAAAPARAAAQQPDTADARRWNDPRVAELVERATALRSAQLSDSGLRDYRASARGYLTFLAQLGDEFRLPPKIVKADQIALQLFWQAPDRSKQIVVGMRDTLLLPGDIGYYRDRYGIVQNNFPDRIRLGDGNDVRDVPHPLSPIGRQSYDFSIGDSLRLNLGDRTITVVEVRVRPRDAERPAVVGTLYLDRATAQLARMALTFTRAALRDQRIETLSVTLENGLVDGRFWLPRRQELEVVRTANWLDFPARGIIRGRWEICCYQTNTSIPAEQFVGPEIVVSSPAELRQYRFEGNIVDSLPDDIALATTDDVETVRSRAQELVRGRALQRSGGAALSGRSISDFVRVNRVEGLAVGAGALVRLGADDGLLLRARYGMDDRAIKGRAAFTRALSGGRSIALFGMRDYADVGDVQETSLVRNSIAAQEFGSDYTNPYETRGAGITATLGSWFGARWQVEGAWERHYPLAINAVPANGMYEATIPARQVDGGRISLALDRPAAESPFGTTLGWRADLRLGSFGSDVVERRLFSRLALSAELSGRLAGRRVIGTTLVAGVVGSDPDPQQLVFLGGPTTAPGYQFHALAGRFGVSQRVEVRQTLPFLAVPLGRFGRAPGTMTLAPYVSVAAVARQATFQPAGPQIAPSLGVAGLFLFDLLRIDIARGLNEGRWFVGVDVARELWGIF